MKLLIDAGADLNAKDKNGRTALHWAYWYDVKDAIDLLISSGCNTEIKDSKGLTPSEEGARGKLVRAGQEMAKIEAAAKREAEVKEAEDGKETLSIERKQADELKENIKQGKSTEQNASVFAEVR